MSVTGSAALRVGLTSEQAAARLDAEGPNRLPVARRIPAWRRLLAEMVHFFALLFWVAGALAFVAGMPQLGVAVFVVIVLYVYSGKKRKARLESYKDIPFVDDHDKIPGSARGADQGEK